MRFALNITRKLLFLFCLFLITGSLKTATAQIIFDGINCNDAISANGTGTEWGTPMATDYDGITPASADVEEFWAVVQDNYLLVAMKRRGKGNSGFALHVNTDCNDSTGNVGYSGSDYAFFFSIQSGVIQDSTLWKWDSTSAEYVSSGNYFSPILGGSSCSDSTNEYFFEFRIPLATLFEVCHATCNTLDIAQANVHSGGSFSSTIKDELELNINLFINETPEANITVPSIVCANELVSFLGTNSSYNHTTTAAHDSILVYEWDMSYDGVTFNAEETGIQYDTAYTTSGSHTVALKVEDLFGCKSEIDTFTLGVFTRPTLIQDITNGGSCEEVRFYAGGSIDNAGSDNLGFYWDLGDGATSTSDSFTHVYDSCQFYTVFLRVTDPDNPAECASDSVVISSTLPVELLYLEALKQDEQVVVKWATSQEREASYFIIERSLDGNYFTEIQTVEAQGYSNEVTHYEVSEALPNAPVIYYRMIQVDYNGVQTIYGMRALVNQAASPKLSAFPNPASRSEVVTLSGVSIESLTVTDMNGQAISVSHQANQLDISVLNSGVYHIAVQDTQGILHTQLLFIQ